MPFDLSFWKPRNSSAVDEQALGGAVEKIVEARVNLMRSKLETRRAYLEAKAISTDSATGKAAIAAQVEEDDFVLSQILTTNTGA